jgi:valyl-tRNA synthetase
MNKTYDPNKTEKKIYAFWEKGGYFTPKIDKKKKPFTILLPLPNANDPMHMGHALFTIEDIMIRYHRMLGEPTLWLPGGDHAGIETQYVFEKELAKKGKSRFDYDRDTLYQMIVEFTDKYKNINKDQMKILGFSMDWTRYHYSLEPKIVEFVLNTFRKLHQDGLIYRAGRIVNFCTHCGTAFSELEVRYQEQDDQLYYLDYGLIKIATTRPETIFADVAVAVNPKDKRHQKLIGQKATIPLIKKKIPVIGDELVDIKFGTGALKITPGHDETDFQISQKHQLETINIINHEGKLINVPKKYLGLKVDEARKKTVADLKKTGQLVKTKPLKHAVGRCYRCDTTIEPLIMPQWYVKTKPLAAPAIKAVKEGKTKIVPKKRFEKMYFDWLENIRDWNISRQIVWGPRIPAWYCLDCNQGINLSFVKNNQKINGTWKKLKANYSFKEIEKGLQSLTAPIEASYRLKAGRCQKCGNNHILQETDTFDTWFLSGQWPLTTLGCPDSPDFKYFYPTSVLDTLWDILFFWVGRMMMFGLYLADEVPFKVVHLHCRVIDEKGQKMSKSKDNVVNPVELINKYGTDALRIALVFGASPGSDIALGDDKVRAMRNFANKVWNVGRFIQMGLEKKKIPFYNFKVNGKLTKEDRHILKDLEILTKKTTDLIDRYRFDLAAEGLYHFIWHRLADEYIEYSKKRIKNGNKETLSVLRHVYLTCLKLLHPFMPFLTETIWEIYEPYRKDKDPLIISKWPS